jgi:nucleoid DNA-binding protein
MNTHGGPFRFELRGQDPTRAFLRRIGEDHAMNGVGGGRGKKTPSKAEIMKALSASTGLRQKDIAAVFDELAALIGRELGKKGPGTITLPGLVKLKVVRKPATKGRTGINPFTGQAMTIKAKPARNVVAVRVLKNLKVIVR